MILSLFLHTTPDYFIITFYDTVTLRVRASRGSDVPVVSAFLC